MGSDQEEAAGTTPPPHTTNLPSSLAGATLIPVFKGGKVSALPAGVRGKGKLQRLSAEEREALVHGRDGNFAIECGGARVQMPDGSWRGVAPFDIDCKPASDKRPVAQSGYATIEKIEAKLGKLPETLTQITPSGGEHRFFLIPEDLAVSNNVFKKEFGEGIEFQNEGEYVVCAPSVISKEVAEKEGYVAGAYRWKDSAVPIAELPEAYVAYLRAHVSPATTTGDSTRRSVDYDDPSFHRRVAKAIEWCEKADPAVQGEKGSNPTLLVAKKLVAARLPEAVVFDVMLKHYNGKCQPPWSEKELLHKIDDAIKQDDWLDWVAPEGLFASKPSVPTSPEVFGVRWGEWDRTPAPIEYVIDGLLTKSSVNMLVAHGGSLKTWTALSMALAVASGKPWLGKHTTRQGRALIIDFESGEHETVRRVRMLGGAGEQDLGYVWPDLTLTDEAFWKKVEELSVDLIVIDSLSQGSPSFDENAKEASVPLYVARNLVEKTGAAVVFIHHAGKGEKADKREKVRGHSSLFAACDNVFDFSAPGGTTNCKTTRMRCIKSRRGPEAEEIELQFRFVGDRSVTVESVTSTEEVAAREGVFKGLTQDLEDRIEFTLRGGPLAGGTEALARKLGKRVTEVREVVNLMKKKGKVRTVGRALMLDGPEQQRRRIIEAINDAGDEPLKTKSQLKSAAKVDAVDIEQLLDAKLIGLTKQTGFFIAATAPLTEATRKMDSGRESNGT